jgi:glycosyltransferase involved in cell wall biosynthesis
MGPEESDVESTANTFRVDELEVDSAEDATSAEELEAYQKVLESRNARLELNLLKEQRRRLRAEGNLRRLKARKWWRFAGVLGRWRKAPHRIDRLVAETLRLSRDRSPLPTVPDMSAMDARIQDALDIAGGAETAFAGLRRLMDAGAYEEALAQMSQLREVMQRNATVLELRRKAYTALGELSHLLRALNEEIEVSSSSALRRRARAIEGRLIETDTTWLPDVGQTTPAGGRPAVEPNRILHIVKESLPFYERGYTMRSHATFLAQREAGYDPVVTTSLNFPREQGFSVFPPVDIIDGIPYHRLDLGASYELRATPYDLQLSDHATVLMGLAIEARPALIQAGSGYRGYETALVGLAVARALDIPFVYEMRSFLEHTWTAELSRSETGEYYDRRFAQEVRCLSEADHVVTIAETMRQEIIARGIPANKVTVVPNIVDTERFSPRPKNRGLARRYGIDGHTVLGYISNLGQREGITTLIDAVAVMRQQGRDVVGFVPGDGPEAEALRERIAAVGLEESFVLPGHVSNREIEDHYSLIDVFVVPRIDDRASRMVTPLKPLEAMAMGIPVIASNLPALEELVAPEDRGLTFTAGDPGSLVEVAGQLIDTPQLAAQVSATARTWVETERSLSSNARRYESVISGLLS